MGSPATSSSSTSGSRAPRTTEGGTTKQPSPSDKASSSSSPATNAKATSQPAAVSNTASTQSTSGEKSASQDAEDFFARAKAMGLNLTRQDYERARAGVSAFLRAQRVDKGDTATTSTTMMSSNTSGDSSHRPVSNTNPANSSNDSIGHTLMERSPAIGTSAGPGSAKLPSQSKLLSGRSTSSPMLSFFTAVIPSEEDEAKARPSLDDVSALEERKRRRERRRKLRQRLERETLTQQSTASNHVKTLSHSSSLLDESPLTSRSVETPQGRTSSSMPPPSRFEKVAATSNEALQGRVGLGLQMECNSKGMSEEEAAVKDGQEVEAILQSPLRLSNKETSILPSPSLQKLTQKAHIDDEGRLTLLPTPSRLSRRQISEDTMLMSGQEDEVVATIHAGGADTDDSGVFFNVEVPAKKEWGRHERDSSDETSPLTDLHDSLDRMGFLDRVMAQKKSPARLRREAKARKREAEKILTGPSSNDLVVMAATVAPVSASVPQSALLQPVARPHDRGEGAQGRSVRWARTSTSPRQRMTTKEHYDFAFYGIAPTAEASGSFPIFEDDSFGGKRIGAESSVAHDPASSFHVRQRTTSVWMKNGIGLGASGSPVAPRSSMMGPGDSPGALSLSFDGVADRLDALAPSARRGLLFGPSSNDRTPPALSAMEQAELGAHLFSQGPTLARSPARNVFDAFTAATPPAKLTRANTLAAPFSYSTEKSPRLMVEESPDRVMLMRAHSSGALERRLSLLQQRRTQEEESAEDKENITSSTTHVGGEQQDRPRKAPAGWAHRSPMSKYDTISPAAVFGMSSSAGQRNRVLSGDIAEMGRLPLEPSKSQHKHAKVLDEVHSDEEGDDEREADGSPALTDLHDSGRASSPVKMISRKGFEHRNHARDSSASTSVFDDSPMYLDIHNRTASVISAAPSSSSISLARAVGMHGDLDEPNAQKNVEQMQRSSTASKKKKRGQQQLSHSQDDAIMASAEIAPRVASMEAMAVSSSSLGTMEWDKPDGSRVVKLISEELQAALESGTLTTEPPARYYKLPPDWGRSKSKPQAVSYAGMIGQAILSSSDGRLSLNEIYTWISTVFPFFERGDRGWQNSIRHNLSLNKSFIKVERDANVPGKGGWWAIKEAHEDRFRGGSYIAPGSSISQKTSSSKASKGSSQGAAPGSTTGEEEPSSSRPQSHPHEEAGEAQTTRRKRQESDLSEVAVSENQSDSDYVPASHQHDQQHSTKGSSKKSKKARLGKEGTNKKKKDPEEKTSSAQVSVPATQRIPLRPVQASSPGEVPYDTITPSRSYHFTASSGHGSASTASMMAGMPMLTDASSPPSSPNNYENSMPPPPGGVHGAASSQSARKRKQAVSRAVDMMNEALSMSMMSQQQNVRSDQTTNYNLSTNPYNSGNHQQISSHTLQASPLAHMRGGAGNVNAGSLVGNARLRAGHGHSLMGAMDSPLRRHSNGHQGANAAPPSSAALDSPSRLLVNSPISSMRDSATVSMERSTTGSSKDGEAGGSAQADSDATSLVSSSMRGSPTRLSSQQFGQQSLQLQQQQLQQQHAGSGYLSPAGLHLQMALSGQNSPSQQLGSGAAQFLNYGAGNTPTRYSDQNNGNFLYQRWGMSPSPVKAMRTGASPGNQASLFYSQAGSMPGNHINVAASSSNNLDDPFDYSGNLQHELQMTAEMSTFDAQAESPMKMAYPQIIRSQYFHPQAQVQAHQQQQMMQQSGQHSVDEQLQHQVQYLNNSAYPIHPYGGN